MRKCLSIFCFLISGYSYSQFNIGTYRQPYKGSFIKIHFTKDHQFSFHDTRNESCYHWSAYKGQWKITNDTLTLVYPWKHIVYYKTDTGKKFTEENVIEKRLFLVTGDKIKFIGGEGKHSTFDWGNFIYYQRK